MLEGAGMSGGARFGGPILGSQRRRDDDSAMKMRSPNPKQATATGFLKGILAAVARERERRIDDSSHTQFISAPETKEFFFYTKLVIKMY